MSACRCATHLHPGDQIASVSQICLQWKVQGMKAQQRACEVAYIGELTCASAVPDEELAAAVRLCQELRRAPPLASPLWAQDRPQPPLPEAVVSALRRRARLDALHLGGLAPAQEPVMRTHDMPYNSLFFPPT